MTTATWPTHHLSEDDIYRTSSQFRLWSFSPEQLAERRRTTHELALARAARYLRPQHGPASAAAAECLSGDEAARLVQRYCETIWVAAGVKLAWPKTTVITAIQYLKRFYLSNSCLTYPPKEIYKTVMFLASKTEAMHLTLSQYCKNIGEQDVESVLAPEYKVMQALRFTLDVRQPARGLKGCLMELLNMVEGMVGPVAGAAETDGRALQQRLLHLDPPAPADRTPWRAPAAAPRELRHARDRVQLAFHAAKPYLDMSAALTDAYFLYTPAQIIMAALQLADAPLLHLYLDSKLPARAPPRPQILSTVRACAHLLAAYNPDDKSWMPLAERKALEEKLDRCRDPATRDLVQVAAAVKRAGAEDGKVSEQDAKRRRVEREKRSVDDVFGPSLTRA